MQATWDVTGTQVEGHKEIMSYIPKGKWPGSSNKLMTQKEGLMRRTGDYREKKS